VRGYLHQAVAYLVATVLAVAAGWGWSEAFESHLLVTFLVADLVGTFVVFGFSRLHDNSSLYDPYWSVAPIVIAVAYCVLAPERIGLAWPMVAMVALWGGRLTYNFLSGWPGLHHEDWRYRNFREQFPRAYWWVSLGGIHLFPTLLVFAGCLPLYAALFGAGEPNVMLVYIGAFVMLAATAIEALADRQLREFVRSRPPRGTTMEQGLWRYSRHPNYFGELLFWWGIWIAGVGANPESWHWTFAGPLSMTLLFTFVSIPLLDRRSLERREGYAEHMKRVSGLVPLPRRGDG
jgi:steroid 5-alpha reductase family enzyme